MVGSMLGHGLVHYYQGHLIDIALYQPREAPLGQVLRNDIERILARSRVDRAGASGFVIDLTLTNAWVESRSARLTELRGTISASFEFTAELLDNVTQSSKARGTFRGNAEKKILYVIVRDHELVLNEAYCIALSEFQSWLKATL